MTLDSEELRRSLTDCMNRLSAMQTGGLDKQLPCTVESCDAAARSVVFRFDPPADWMYNPFGTLHGGMIAAVLDNAMGIYCALLTPDSGTPTVSLQLSYLRPCPMGSPLHVRAELIRPGRSVSFARATLWVKDERRPVATAEGIYHMGTK